ncbi:probable conjugal transfer protein (plasmid) [Xanthomonas albilineans]|uniref:Probable conjugal transfer protein n=1 Tax=Xanthomonas albilineans (strain GPE PC73 / CFBP 7063) TaxID=380358 RepID=D6CK51_XANAP|nr:probable conjugal transfer protein [Xanthomonas albilineans]
MGFKDMLVRTLLVVLLAGTLAGCASVPPSCDGLNRRPVNQPPQAGVVNQSCGHPATA